MSARPNTRRQGGFLDLQALLEGLVVTFLAGLVADERLVEPGVLAPDPPGFQVLALREQMMMRERPPSAVRNRPTSELKTFPIALGTRRICRTGKFPGMRLRRSSCASRRRSKPSRASGDHIGQPFFRQSL